MSTYSPDLRIELITTGDQAGTWGTTTNTNLAYVVEQAIAGYVSVSVISANQALTYINGGSSTAALNQSVHASLALTTTTGANFAVYAPPASKQYTIYNASSYTATVYNSTVIGNTTAAGTGVAIPAGKTVTVWSDGTNFAAQNTHLPGTVTADTAAPGTNTTQIATTAFVTAATGGLGTMATQNANNVAITGGSITGITDLAVADGGTGASSFTSGGLVRGNGSSALSVASASDIVTQIGSTAVTNATNATNASSVTNGVYTVGDQTIGGTKTFSNGITFGDATVQTTAAGAVNTTTVLNATAGASVGAVGTYAFLMVNNTSSFSVSAGSTSAGSSLRYAGNNSTTAGSYSYSGTPSGTWRCMGYAIKTTIGCSDAYSQATVWLRIS